MHLFTPQQSMPTAVLLILLIIGYATLGLAARAVRGDRRLSWLVWASFTVRVLSTFVLFAASWFHWPLFRPLQIGQGFWAFGLDSRVYHNYASKIADAWAKGIETPTPELGIEYFAVVAAVYRLLGARPLYAILLNCWLSSCTVVLAYLIGRRVLDRRTGLIAAMLIAFWPSSILWSSQLLKDSLSSFLVFGGLCAILYALPRSNERAGWRHRLAWLITAVFAMLLTRLRVYLGSALAAAALLAVPATVFQARRTRQLAPVAWSVSMALVVGGCVLFGRSFNTLQWLQPAHPELAHFQLGKRYWSQGQLAEANEEFHMAWVRCPTFKEAHLAAAAVEIYRENYNDALLTYQHYLPLENSANRDAVKRVMARLSLRKGNALFLGRQLNDAITAYENAVRYDPELVPAQVALGVSYLQDQQYGPALARLRRGMALGSSTEQSAIAPFIAQAYEEFGDVQYAYSSDRIADALAAYESALVYRPFAISTFERIAVALRHAKLHNLALERMRESWALPLSSEARWKLRKIIAAIYADRAALAVRNKQPGSALPDFDTAVATDPFSVLIATRAMVIKQSSSSSIRYLRDAGNDADEYLRSAWIHEATSRSASFASAPITRGQQAVGRSDANSGMPETLRISAAVDPQSTIDLRSRALRISPLASESTTASQSVPVAPARGQLVSLSQLNNEAHLAVSETLPGSLDSRRHAFVMTGGHSLVDASAKISSPPKLLRYVPRALAIALFGPFPWQWLDTTGSTGAMRTLAGLEMFVFYLLLPSLAVGLRRLLKPLRADSLYLIGFVLFGLLAISLVVANLGTLFRLRLQFLLPLLIVVAAGDPPRIARRLARRLRAAWQRLRPASRSPQPGVDQPSQPELAAMNPPA